MFTRWYELDDETNRETQIRLQRDVQHRQANVEKSREDEQLKVLQADDKYRPADLRRRIRQINELSAEHQKNEEVLDYMAMRSLQRAMEKKQQDVDKRVARREKKFEKFRVDELERLKEILGADTEGRAQDRKEQKDKRKQDVEKLMFPKLSKSVS